MAVTFLEPGGDLDISGNAVITSTGGLWGFKSTFGLTESSTILHGRHKSSYRPVTGSTRYVASPNGVVADAGTRISMWLFINAQSTVANHPIYGVEQANDGTLCVVLQLTTAGVLQLWESSNQLGSNGPTLSTSTWYRISLAYTITSTTVNRFEVNVYDSTGTNSIGGISVTNGTITNTTTSCLIIGIFQSSGSGTLDISLSDIYVDNSSALTDPGNIWVTAKRPFANGTTNGFTTQIGAGGSGYGTGHSPQVNERPISNTNGWSMVGAGSAVTEEYNIEGKSVGDIDISTATIVDWLGWATMKSLAGETVQIILDGANNSQAITSTITTYMKIKGSSTYPSGTGADIGITTDTSLTTVSLYECGILVAYIPPLGTRHLLASTGVGS